MTTEQQPEVTEADPFTNTDEGHLTRLRDRLMDEARKLAAGVDIYSRGTSRMAAIAVRSAESEAVRRVLEERESQARTLRSRDALLREAAKHGLDLSVAHIEVSAENERLRKAIHTYSRHMLHHEDCPAFQDANDGDGDDSPECECGLTALKRAATKAAAAELEGT